MSAKRRQVEVDFSRTLRPIGKLNGVNNGPIHTFTDRTKEYRELGIDFVRFHETHASSTKCVEIPFIFRDFSKDENDPANYYFAETDAVIKGAVDAGIEIMFRLGMGTERSAKILFAVAPLDFEKWARVAEHVILHYNKGWANGFHYNIRYWEVWNEPDLEVYWKNPAWKPEEIRPKFVEFYCVVSKYLKQKFPDILIGAAGMATTRPKPFPADSPKALTWNYRMKMYDLLGEAIESGRAEADFFAFHSYHGDIFTCRYKLERMMSLLRDFHLTDLEIINTEWNAITLKADSHGRWYMDQMVTAHSAVDCLATMLIYQRGGISKAAYYDPEDRSRFNGLYDYEGNYRCHAYPLMIVKKLREAGTEVSCEGFETDCTTAVAACGNDKALVVLANDGEDQEFTLRLSGIPACPYAMTLLDTALHPVRKGRYSGRALPLSLKRDTALVLEFELSKEKV